MVISRIFIIFILMSVMAWSTIAVADERLDWIPATEGRLHEDDLLRIRGRGVSSSGTGGWQGNTSKIILWDEAKKPGVVTISQSFGDGSIQSTTLSVNTR